MARVKAGAVVVAAGSSVRLPGGLPKPYLRAGGMTLLARVLAAFERASSVAGVVVVARAEELARASRVAASFGKVVAVVPGGRLRQDSVYAGLEKLPRGLDPVLVHDAARPLVRPEVIEEVALAAVRYGAAVVGKPVVDTLKEVRRGRVVATVDRSALWRAETPQAFRRAWLEAGFRRALSDQVEVTDDAMLVERLGRVVHMVHAQGPNFKVTTPGDLDLVRAILARRGRS